ncbi:hypothetical protein PENTCL1PPCAC_4147, partial [Pristionchus entomophagus]
MLVVSSHSLFIWGFADNDCTTFKIFLAKSYYFFISIIHQLIMALLLRIVLDGTELWPSLFLYFYLCFR